MLSSPCSPIHRTVAIVSLLALLHAAYSAAQHRLYLRLTEQDFSSLPTDIVAQTLISLVVLVWSCTYVAGSFQPIRADITNGKRKWEDQSACPSFITFEHRAKPLSPSYALLSGKPFEVRVGSSGVERDYSSPSSPPIPLPRPQLVSSTPTPSPDFSRLPGARTPSASSSSRSFPRRPPSPDAAKAAFLHCVQLLKKHDRANYLAALLMPRAVQPRIFALLAVNVEIALTRDKVSSVSTTAMYRLKFWRDTLTAIYTGEGVVPQQPVATALRAFAPSSPLPLLDLLASTRQSTIGDRPFVSLGQVAEYGRNSTGSLLRLQMHALGYSEKEEKIERAVDLLAESYAILNLVRSAGPFTLRRTVLLPSDVLQSAGVTPDNVISGKKGEELKKAIASLVEEGKSRLLDSRSLRPSIPRPLRLSLMATAAQCEHVVKMATAGSFDIRSPLLQRERPLLPWRLVVRKWTGRY